MKKLLVLLLLLPSVAFAAALDDVDAIATGQSHTCALISGGTVKCWGANTNGQLGDGTTTSRFVPTSVTGLTSVASLAAGGENTCAVTSAGALRCWGANFYGQLGDGTSKNNKLTSVVVVSSGVASVSVGQGHICFVTTGGGAKCLGKNVNGELGDGTTTNRLSPVDVTGLTSGVAKVAAGGSSTCARTTGNAVKCWGNNIFGQLGRGTDLEGNTIDSLTPVSVTDYASSGATDLFEGDSHFCVIESDGDLACWGSNITSQLGDATVIDAPEPVEITVADDVADLALGNFHSCAALADETVQCWGEGEEGQTGNGTDRKSTPALVLQFDDEAAGGLVNFDGAVAVATGAHHTCVLMSDDTVQCWGKNQDGQLGDGTTKSRLMPVVVQQ